MSVWPTQHSPASPPGLHGTEGELVSVHIRVEPKLLEELLEALAAVPFPVNPEIDHHATILRHGQARRVALVAFPAYAGRLEDVRRTLRLHGFEDAVEVVSMIAEIQGT